MSATELPPDEGTNQLPTDVTRLLQASDGTNQQEELYRLVADHLRRIANAQMNRERSDHTLQPTVLVDEAFVQLVNQNEQIAWEGRSHFYRAAARAMRHILIDYERKRRAAKRGAGAVKADVDVDQFANSDGVDIIALHEALDKLAEVSPRQAEVIQMRHFGGYKMEEIAKMLGVSLTTVRNDHAAARIWLFRVMSDGNEK